MRLPHTTVCSLGDSCASSYWSRAVAPGVEALDVHLTDYAFGRHAHDTYTIVVTTGGIQEFYYRGSIHRSSPGEVVVLHPGEIHDGKPGAGRSFSYRGLHLSSATARDHLPPSAPRGSLPFVPAPVVRSPKLCELAATGSRATGDELLNAQLLSDVMDALQSLASGASAKDRGHHSARIRLAEEYLSAHAAQSVRLEELVHLCGLSVAELCRQFRHCYGTSPYRYLRMRRVQLAMDRIRAGQPLAEVAVATGFSDQPQMNRAFRSFVGLTPGVYAALQFSGQCEQKLNRLINGCSPDP